jgi:hypothetical protein
LSDLEEERSCGIATRNQRLATGHALALFIGLHAPERLEKQTGETNRCQFI